MGVEDGFIIRPAGGASGVWIVGLDAVVDEGGVRWRRGWKEDRVVGRDVHLREALMDGKVRLTLYRCA